jgi:dTDP-4-dehydrorhamnose reductase
MRVVITGAGGQLGRELLEAYAGHDVTGLTHEQLDVADEDAVHTAVADLRPDLVVHAAAWTDVDGCERDPDRAHAVNALGPWWLARAGRERQVPVVLVSTDYVFGGRGPGDAVPYTEFDPIAPINAYGRSKAAGEQLVRQTLPEHYIVRTSWVFGRHGTNFVKTMQRLGAERDEVRVVDDQIGSPTYAADLAVAIRELAASGRFGTYHRTNSGACSWFELAAETFRIADLPVDLRPQGSHELDRLAPRPRWSVLSNRHTELVGFTPMPTWQAALRRMLRDERSPDDVSADDVPSGTRAPVGQP